MRITAVPALLFLLAGCQQDGAAKTNPDVTPNATARLELDEVP
jgi:hypothetical protein